MSRNVDKTYAFYISGRQIQLYEVSYTGAADKTGKIRIPEFSSEAHLIYPDETISAGLMFQGTAFIEPFVDVEPNELTSLGAMPVTTEVPNGDIDETSHINLNRMLSLACVDYIQAMLEDRKGDVGKKEYYIKEFYSKLADSESNKRRNIMTFPVTPYALR